MDPFEDILDGYFPLRTSVTDLMQRCGIVSAKLTLTFAPIMEVEGLPNNAPVPLNIRDARAGMIYNAELAVSICENDATLSGHAHWGWFDGEPTGKTLNPMTRLAEPALVLVHPKIGLPWTVANEQAAIVWHG